MIVRSSVNACCTSSQKSSSWATSAGERPARAWFALTTRASAWSRRAGTAAPAATRDSRKRRRVNIEARLLSGTHQSPHQHAVGDQVHRQHQRAERRLRRSREAGRVEQGDDVVLHEAAAGALEPGAGAERVLERRERADPAAGLDGDAPQRAGDRSEEHTSELQSQSNLVCRLLLEKKKKLLIHVHMTLCTRRLH